MICVDGVAHATLTGDARLFVVGGGKAAESALGDRIERGIAVGVDSVTADAQPLRRIEYVCGTHPLPSEANVKGTARVLDLLKETREGDVVLALVSGERLAHLCSRQPSLTRARLLQVARLHYGRSRAARWNKCAS